MVRHVEEGVRALRQRALAAAVSAFERAHALVNQGGLGADVAQGVLGNLAAALGQAGEYARAVEAYRAALALPGLSAEDRARAFNGLGVTLGRMGRHADAYAALRQAYRAWRQTGSAAEQLRTLVNMVVFLRKAGRLRSARRLAAAALRGLGAAPADVRYLARLEAAAVEFDAGDGAACLRHLAAVSDQRDGPASDRHQSEALRLRAAVARRSGRPREALRDAALALDLAVRTEEWEAIEDAFRELRALAAPAGPEEGGGRPCRRPAPAPQLRAPGVTPRPTRR